MNKKNKEIARGFGLLALGSFATGCALVFGAFAINNVFYSD